MYISSIVDILYAITLVCKASQSAGQQAEVSNSIRQIIADPLKISIKVEHYPKQWREGLGIRCLRH